MGYYTKYDITYTTTNPSIQEEELVKKLIFINKNLGYSNYTPETFEELFEEPMKWYDYEKDMFILAMLFPDVQFTVYGHGEDEDDIWKHYFQGDREQLAPAKITYDEPNIFK